MGSSISQKEKQTETRIFHCFMSIICSMQSSKLQHIHESNFSLMQLQVCFKLREATVIAINMRKLAAVV